MTLPGAWLRPMLLHC